MSKPFKFRYVNQIAGTFVLIVVGLLAAAVFLAGKAKGWFTPTNHVTITIPEGSAEGLGVGADVTILGTSVGRVSHIAPLPDGSMEADLRIRGDYFDQYVRADSVAMIKKKFGLGGDAFIAITRGKGARLDEKNATLRCKFDTELALLLQEGFEEAKFKTLETLDLVQALLKEYTLVASDLRNPEGELQRMLANLNRISQGLADGEGPAGALLRDPAFTAEIKKLTAQVNESLAHVNGLLVEARKSAALVPGLVSNVTATTAGLPAIVGKVDRSLDGVPTIVNAVGAGTPDVFALIRQAEHTLRATEATLRGLQNHWLLRKAMEEGSAVPADGLLDPEALRRAGSGATP